MTRVKGGVVVERKRVRWPQRDTDTECIDIRP